MLMSVKKHNRIIDHIITKGLKKNKDDRLKIKELQTEIDNLLSLSEEELIDHQVNKILQSVANSGL